MMDSASKPQPTSMALLLGIGLAFGLAGYLAFHWSYYGLSPAERPFDVRHAALRSSGSVGLSIGLAGTALMLLNLTYLVRKRLISIAWLGSLRKWMNFHVLTGLLGPSLIVLHTAFAPSSSLGKLALIAMFIVVATGVMGRYIYIHVPRSYHGRELEIGEVRRRLVEYREALEVLGVDPTSLKYESSTDAEENGKVGILSALRHMLQGDREAHRQFHQLQKRMSEKQADSAKSKEIHDLLHKLCRERQWLVRYHELRELMGAWRFFHRWLAVVLFLVVGFHILLAFRFGSLWIIQS
ncbi:MAG: hypothetical protein K9M54_00200 [Kiritimatiellales bacterium]|nr:hypothetical protein [Kiritimatiellales bacterium]